MKKHPHEIYQEAKAQRDAEELSRIINKPMLEAQEIWSLAPQNFLAWRMKYDFPRILSHFSQYLTRFDEWKAEYKFTDELLMSFGISNCINPNPGKDKRKFIVERSSEGEITKMISYQNLDGKFYKMGPNSVNHKVLSSFLGYIDWSNSKGLKIMADWKDNGLLSRPSSSHPIGMPHEIEINILGGLSLLKVGGIEVQSNPYEGVTPRYFEFVNASYLTLRGKHSQQLTFENSIIDNLECENLDLPIAEFRNSSLKDLHFKNSRLIQWAFNFSNVSGKIHDCDLSKVYINGGLFNVDFNGCTFTEVHARHHNKRDLSFENTYRTLKQIYAVQGDDKKAIEYFLLEKRMERESIRHNISHPSYFKFFSESKWKVCYKKAILSSISSFKYATHLINNFYWGYGRKPFRVVRNSALLILLFACIYYWGQSNMRMPETQTGMTIGDSLYYSTVTFTTLGYGDFSPLGYLRIVAAIEAFLGGISLGFFVAGFSNFKY